MSKNTRIGFCLVLAVLLFFITAFTIQVFSAFSSSEKASYVYIDSDDNADSVYNKLKAADPSARVGTLRLMGVCCGYSGHVYPGRYATGEGISVFTLMRNLRGRRQVPVRLVIPVVHTLGDLSAYLAGRLMADSTAWMKAFTDTTLLSEHGFSPEEAACRFIPNTHEVYWDICPVHFLRLMNKEYRKFWSPERRKLSQNAGLKPNEVYTLASIVEQESQNESERPRIAGMYLNRLRKGMKLQADPTVKFALGDFTLRRILHDHLKTDSPYNTYRYEGLPPGPICIPSISAIDAVLHYERHSYIYMCAKEDFSGTHNFAVTYSEHVANARRYAEALDKRGIQQ